MGRKRKNPKQEGMNISLDISDDSSSSKPEIWILGANFKQILEVVKENGNKLDDIYNQLGTLTTRVDNLDRKHSLLQNKMVNSELKFVKIENDRSFFKLEIRTCNNEIINLGRKKRLNVLDCQIGSHHVRK